MLVLKEINQEDWQKEYEYITSLPEDENGFKNRYAGVSKEEFEEVVLMKVINEAKGIDLEPGHVPQTTFFLWDEHQIVGLFRVRHYLNDALRNGSGHIGYGIKKEFRGKGYATKGLALAIEKAKEIIKEDEIYLSVYRYNIASLRIQQKNGAYIHHSDENEHYTRIKINN